MPTTTPPDILDVELAGIDALDVPIAAAPSRARLIWSAAWPKLLATAITHIHDGRSVSELFS